MRHSMIWLAIALALRILAVEGLTSTSAGETRRPWNIAVLSDDLPGSNQAWSQALADHLRHDQFHVTELSAAEVCTAEHVAAERCDLLVIPSCRTYPAAGLDVLVNYARHGGRVLLLGGPFLDDPVWQGPDGWLNREAITAIKRNALPRHRPFPPDQLSTAGWQRACNDRANPGTWDVVPEGPDGTRCLRFTTQNLTGWDGYLSPDVPQLFGPQHDLFLFQAKGSPTTTQLAVEIQEQDGSRWIAVTSIGPDWQRVALEPRDFKYWPDSHNRGRRGGAGDQLHPDQARRVNFQLAQSHTTAVPPGGHAFWIADIGTCTNPVADLPLTAATDVSLESIFPRYKVYTVNEPVGVVPAKGFEAWTELAWQSGGNLVCAIPRTMGRGFDRDQRWRYIPLATATDTDGRQRGCPVWMLLNHSGPLQGSVFACVGCNDLQTPARPPVLQLVSRIARRLQTGAFLQEAGAEHFVYWPGEPMRVGATAVNRTTGPVSATVHTVVTDPQGSIVLDESQSLELAAGQASTWSTIVPLPPNGAPGALQITTELLVGATPLDRISHQVNVLDPGRPARDEFMRVQDNDFYVHGRKWYPVGVNYWPLYVSGMDHADYWAGWITRPYYDPELVEQDLQRMQTLGINLVSIQAHDPKYYRNLLDFIHRCSRHEIYVNLFCGLASPLGFREDELRQFIQTARLADNPTIVAYDTIWEPGNYVFSADWRPRWDRDWNRWLVEQYGSVAAAEQDWGVPCPRNEAGDPTSPPDAQFRNDGPWRPLLAAYRRFMDDLMSRKWNRAHRRLRDLDPSHLISFRQGNTLPHDFTFTATAKHIDFICPEGYAIPHSDEGYNAAGFITRYVHFTTGGKPIVWSEFGQSVWDSQTMAPSPARIETVADYHELFYRMVLESGANGTVPWWWPGGYRVGERSDFGILNPDTTPRPAAELITRYAPRLKAARAWPAPTAWFDMDRDAHAGGYWYMCFHSGSDAYRQAIAAGAALGVRTAGTGTTSADTPLLAVGNRPATGQNPPKFLNAEFNWVRIRDTRGQWVEAEDGARIPVARNDRVRAQVHVGNTQEATWIAPAGPQFQAGDVVLATTPASQLTGLWPLPRTTPYLADADFGELELTSSITEPTRVELRMDARQRSGFGEKRAFLLVPE